MQFCIVSRVSWWRCRWMRSFEWLVDWWIMNCGGSRWKCSWPTKKYSTTPIIRKLVIRIANYPQRIGTSGKHFLSVIILKLLRLKIFSQLSKKHVINYGLMFYLYLNKYVTENSRLWKFFFSTSKCRCRQFSKKKKSNFPGVLYIRMARFPN